MAKSKIKTGDTVLVIAGKKGDKGSKGTVLKVLRDEDRILVEGINRVVRHQRVTPGPGGSRAGGLVHQEAPIHISNVKLVESGTRDSKADKGAKADKKSAKAEKKAEQNTDKDES